MNYWETKDGDSIPYNELETEHLINILTFIKRRAKEGVEVTVPLGYAPDNDYMEYDSYVITGKEVLEHFDYKGLLKELNKRRIE